MHDLFQHIVGLLIANYREIAAILNARVSCVIHRRRLQVQFVATPIQYFVTVFKKK